MIDNMNLVMHNSLLLISRVLLMLFMFVDLEFILYIISSLIKNLFINLHQSSATVPPTSPTTESNACPLIPTDTSQLGSYSLSLLLNIQSMNPSAQSKCLCEPDHTNHSSLAKNSSEKEHTKPIFNDNHIMTIHNLYNYQLLNCFKLYNTT